MTRRQVFARALPAAALCAFVTLFVAGCEGGNSGKDLSKISPERQAELDKQAQASEAYSKQQAEKR